MSNLPTDTAPIGLETAAKRLKAEAPDCALTRYQLYRLCIAGRIPCMQMPAITGRSPRYKVAMRSLVSALRKLYIAAPTL